MPDLEPIGVIGVGWVGLVTAACFAELGHEVYCRDIVQEKVDALKRGELPIYEPGLPELVERNKERLHFTTDMGEVLGAAELLFCCVDTPPTYSGDADLTRVERVLEEIGDPSGRALVMKSTVPVGTGRSIKRRSEGLAYVSNPEFLKEGSAVDDFMKPDRVVVGADDDSGAFADRISALYEPLGGPIVRTDVASAEMIKLASNAFLATKISFINEIANVSEELGADVNEVARGMGLDARIGPQFLRAGIGYGGSCLVGDETVLVRRLGRTTLMSLEALWELCETEGHDGSGGVIEPDEIEVMSWVPGDDRTRFMPVSMLTRRTYDGDLVVVRTAAGHELRCTVDHPFVVAGDAAGAFCTKLAEELAAGDGLPALTPGSDFVGPASVLAPPRPMSVTTTATLQLASAVDEVESLLVGRTDVVGIRRSRFAGPVYSLEVPGAHTFVTTDGVICHNCFPKDVSALKQLAGNSGYHFQLLTAVIEVNELQKRRTVNKLKKHLGALAGKEIALLGVAFKPNTDDIREATSLVLAGRLQGEGANVRAYDPVAGERAAELLGAGVRICASSQEALDGADGAVLVTEWPEFGELDWVNEVKKLMKTPLVVDGRNFLDRDALVAAGFTYEGVGR
ncbi:MAG TPA: nucleotide sugar dehydrogenase [Thermoleophilaceae bacterium]